MFKEEIDKLQPGDEVFWNDPDAGACSRPYTIGTIKIKGTIVSITDVSGDTLECFGHELS